MRMARIGKQLAVMVVPASWLGLSAHAVASRRSVPERLYVQLPRINSDHRKTRHGGG